MAGLGEPVRGAISTVIDSIGSTITITSFTKSSEDSGYSGQVETLTGTTIALGVPFNELIKLLKQTFGDLKAQDNEMAVKSTTIVDVTGTTRYKITFNNSTYDVMGIDPFTLNDVIVAWIWKLSRRFD